MGHEAEAVTSTAAAAPPAAGLRDESSATIASLQRRVADLLAHQAATNDILQAIGRAGGELQPVLDAIVANAARLCDSIDAQIFRVDGDVLRPAASYGSLPKISAGESRPLNRGSLNGRAVVDRCTIHVHDLAAVDENEWPEAKTFQKRFGHRTILATPLIRDGVPLGAITVRRMEVRPFSDDQIALLETFAEQASIAIENVRLFNETKEALEQQTATAEILRVISSSPSDVQPVFEAIARHAAALTAATFSYVTTFDGEWIHLRATHGVGSEEHFAFYPVRPGSGAVSARVIRDRAAVQIEDVLADPDYAHKEAARATGFRSAAGVPMMREGKVVGAIAVTRPHPGAVPDKLMRLLRIFADQAAIAIENVRLFTELEVKGRELEAASRHKSEFLANMSHELRTPLNAIIGFSEVLQERMFGEVNDKQAEYLADILESGKHLLTLINDILDLSKIEAGRMELQAGDFDLRAAIDNALLLVRERAQRRGIALECDVDARLHAIRADERKVKQVLLNLLSNALKFTPEGGRVRVDAALGEAAAEISVSDTGVGIAPQDLAAVFEEFRQVGTAAKNVEGTGLGLAISRKFVELHGGTIAVKSVVGEGSTFTFTLPLHDLQATTV
jgi:signal transduction histidine kinase